MQTDHQPGRRVYTLPLPGEDSREFGLRVLDLVKEAAETEGTHCLDDESDRGD